jgi:hypothetical protein
MCRSSRPATAARDGPAGCEPTSCPDQARRSIAEDVDVIASARSRHSSIVVPGIKHPVNSRTSTMRCSIGLPGELAGCGRPFGRWCVVGR